MTLKDIINRNVEPAYDCDRDDYDDREHEAVDDRRAKQLQYAIDMGVIKPQQLVLRFHGGVYVESDELLEKMKLKQGLAAVRFEVLRLLTESIELYCENSVELVKPKSGSALKWDADCDDFGFSVIHRIPMRVEALLAWVDGEDIVDCVEIRDIGDIYPGIFKLFNGTGFELSVSDEFSSFKILPQ